MIYRGRSERSGGKLEGIGKSIERNGAGAQDCNTLGRTFGPSTWIPWIFRVHTPSCSRPCPFPPDPLCIPPPRSSERALLRRGRRSFRRSKRQTHRNPTRKVGGKKDFLVEVRESHVAFHTRARRPSLRRQEEAGGGQRPIRNLRDTLADLK